MGTEEETETGGGVATASDSLTITDNRTGKTYEVPVQDGTIRATALREIKVNEEDFGVMSYDPAFMNTASCRSAITYLDGENGVLEYRGYPIEQLAEHSTYLEVAYLLVHGELPNSKQLDEWTHGATEYTGGWSEYDAERERRRARHYDRWEGYVTEKERIESQARRMQQWEERGYGQGRSMDVIRQHAPRARILDPFVMEADQERRTLTQVSRWLSRVDIQLGERQ